MPDTWSRRRALRAIGATAALGLAGCSERSSQGTSTDATTATVDTPTDSPTATTTGEPERPTATERSPRPLDASGSWPQFGADAGHTGVTGATGLPENGEPYWHLRRIRSGAPVLSDGWLFHYAKLGEDRNGRPTATREFNPLDDEPENDEPIKRQYALVARAASDGRIEWS